MKEATGELSTTVIAIVAIAAILAVFTVFLLPTLRAQIALSQACTSGPGFHTKTAESEITCDGDARADQTGQTWTCTYKDKDGNENTKTCKN